MDKTNYKEFMITNIEDLLRESFGPLIRKAVTSAIAEAVAETIPKAPKYGRLMSVTQLANESGYSKHTIYQKNCNHEIPGSVKIGGKLMFETATALAWVADGCRTLKKS
jgi:predicted DNA-binding transcriptional regulator AlpA